MEFHRSLWWPSQVICGFGGDVQVLDPPEARADLARLAATLTQQYGEAE